MDVQPKTQLQSTIPRQFIVSLTEPPPGYMIAQYLGMVHGTSVRYRNAAVIRCASIKTCFGGSIQAYRVGSEEARKEAYDRMVQEACSLGANAILNVNYNASEIEPGANEAMAYGTAVRLVARNRGPDNSF